MISSTHLVRYSFDFSRRPSRSTSGRSRNSESTSRKELWCLFWAVDGQRRLRAQQGRVAVVGRTLRAALLPLCFLGVVGRVGVGAVLALRPLVGQGVLQHADVPVQLVVQLLCAAQLALLLRDLRLHLGALNVPRVAGALVAVPFELQEAHHACRLVSRAASHHAASSAASALTLQCVLCPGGRIAVSAAVRCACVHGRRRLPCHGGSALLSCSGVLDGRWGWGMRRRGSANKRGASVEAPGQARAVGARVRPGDWGPGASR